jgi:hypothetical protein
MLKVISRKIVKKTLELISKLADPEEDEEEDEDEASEEDDESEEDNMKEEEKSQE